jgi:DNA replication protein DnaD
VHTIEDAEIVLSRSKAVLEGTRKILRRLGKRHQPSEDEMALYHKWTMDWGYDHEAIEAACRETTKGDPTMAYLDGILNGLRKRGEKTPSSAKQVENQLQKEQDAAAPLKELFRALGISGLTVNEGTLSVYRQMRDVAGHDVILLAAREAARFGGRLDDVFRLLSTWHDKGLTTTRQVEEYIAAFYESNRLLAQLFEQCGKSEKPTASDRSLLAKWQKEWNFATDMLVLAASFSQTADKKMPYMDAMLRAWHEQGISTQEAAQAARERFEKTPAAATAVPQRKGKVVTAQLYTQRTYDEIDLNKWAASMIEEAKESDA